MLALSHRSGTEVTAIRGDAQWADSFTMPTQHTSRTGSHDAEDRHDDPAARRVREDGAEKFRPEPLAANHSSSETKSSSGSTGTGRRVVVLRGVEYLSTACQFAP